MIVLYRYTAMGVVDQPSACIVDVLRSAEDRKTIYFMLDAFVGKKKLKETLSNVLQEVE